MSRASFRLLLLVALSLWSSLAGAERPAERLLEEAAVLEEAANGSPEEERVALLGRSSALLERALALEPRSVELRFALGRVLGDEALGNEALERAVRELLRARKDDAAAAYDWEIAQLLGVHQSRRGRFVEAVAEYDRALRAIPGMAWSPAQRRGARAMCLGNSAEALMAVGRLGEAIERYAQAEALETSDQAALHSLGLAVAYDRDGQREKSREALVRSLTTNPGLRLFQDNKVFFVPAGDRHYYVALLAEAVGNREQALDSWQAFLRALPQSRYAARARGHLEALRRMPGLSAAEILRAEVVVGEPLFPPERPLPQPRRGPMEGLPLRVRSESDISRVAADHATELRQCYAWALRREGRTSGDLEIALVLDGHGAVALAEVLRANLGIEGDRERGGPAAQELQQCAVNAMRRWRFPPADQDHDELALPLRFEARR